MGTKIIRIINNDEISSGTNEPILCRECKNDSFNLNKSDIGSLNVICNKCGAATTFGAGMDIKSMISILQRSLDKKI